MFGVFNKKKKAFKATCQLSNEPIEKGASYCLTTAEIIKSKKFWDYKMTEPDTMSYTIAHFSKGDETARNIRTMIFNKYSSEDKPWIISESHVHLFDFNEEEARQLANEWWDKEGNFAPESHTCSLKNLGDQFEEIKEYAVMDAGRKWAEAEGKKAV